MSEIIKTNLLTCIFCIINLYFTSARGIYLSMDNSIYSQSKYINESNLKEAYFISNQITDQDNLEIPYDNFSFDFVLVPPIQDFVYGIYEEDKGNFNFLENFTLIETTDKSNIFYDKFKSPLMSNENLRFPNMNKLYNKFLLNIKNDKSIVNSKIIHKVECNVNYTGLMFSQINFNPLPHENLQYENVINFMNINIVTYNNLKGIFIEKFIEGKLSAKYPIETFVNNKVVGFNNKIFSKIIKSFGYQKYYMFLVDSTNENLYLLRLNSEYDMISNDYTDKISLTIDILNVFKRDDLGDIDLSKISTAGLLQEQSNFILTTNNGNKSSIYHITYSDKIHTIDPYNIFKDPSTNQTIDFEISDSIIANSICFVILKNYGLIYFSPKRDEIGLVLKHPKLLKLDSYSYGIENIGLYLNNDKSYDSEDSREFFIELFKVNNLPQQYYDINKVFFSYSENKTNFYDNVIFDEAGNINFIIEKNSNKVYYIARNLPHVMNNIDGVFELPNEFKDMEYKGFNLVSVYKTENSKEKFYSQGILALQTESKKIMFYNFLNNNDSYFNCKFNVPGNFIFKYNFGIYKKEQINNFTLIKNITTTKTIREGEGNPILIIILLVVLVGFIILAFFLYKKYKKTKIDITYKNLNS